MTVSAARPVAARADHLQAVVHHRSSVDRAGGTGADLSAGEQAATRAPIPVNTFVERRSRAPGVSGLSSYGDRSSRPSTPSTPRCHDPAAAVAVAAIAGCSLFGSDKKPAELKLGYPWSWSWYATPLFNPQVLGSGWSHRRQPARGTLPQCSAPPSPSSALPRGAAGGRFRPPHLSGRPQPRQASAPPVDGRT